MSNVDYRFVNGIGYGTLPDGSTFLFDEELFHRIKDIKWYQCFNKKSGAVYITNRSGETLHQRLMDCPSGYEVDHINLDTLDNRRRNLRICTHQQNQCNQPVQSNNTSGFSGVSFYAPRAKYRARIKASQHDIHLGYYQSLREAVQARNVGMECMFGEYGQYNNVTDAPLWIREKVIRQCERFADLAVHKAFFNAQ